MDKWVRKIEYKKYDSSVFSSAGKWDVRKAKEICGGEFSITNTQLAISIARSVLTRAHIYSPEVAAFARSYLSTISFILSERNNYLAINHHNKDILRDFSKSTRHGEIAQGINYFYAKRHLGAYAVYDFNVYKKERRNINRRCPGRIPDYILCYPNGTIGILESKGTTVANPTGSLISAHEQCENGKKFLHSESINVKNTYASVVSFAMSSNEGRNTCLYIADPEDEGMFRDDNWERNNLYEYSKWFYLAGNGIVTEKLMAGQTPSIQDFESNRKVEEGVIVGSWSLELPPKKEDINRMLDVRRTVRVSLGIIPELQEYLIKGQTFRLHKKIKQDELVSSMNIEKQNITLFDDGTFILVD